MQFQEYSEYVSVKDSEALPFNLGSSFRQKRSIENLSGGVKSRDSSPVQSVKQDSELDNVDKDQYYQKVGEKNVLFPRP